VTDGSGDAGRRSDPLVMRSSAIAAAWSPTAAFSAAISRNASAAMPCTSGGVHRTFVCPKLVLGFIRTSLAGGGGLARRRRLAPLQAHPTCRAPVSRLGAPGADDPTVRSAVGHSPHSLCGVALRVRVSTS